MGVSSQLSIFAEENRSSDRILLEYQTAPQLGQKRKVQALDNNLQQKWSKLQEIQPGWI